MSTKWLILAVLLALWAVVLSYDAGLPWWTRIVLWVAIGLCCGFIGDRIDQALGAGVRR